MGQQIEINTNTLRSDIEDMHMQLGTIVNDIDKMYEAVQYLDGMWNGPANEAFVQQFLLDKADMEDLCKTIENVIEYMEFAQNEYDICEDQVNGIVSGIRI